MPPLFQQADKLSSLVIRAATEVHRELGSGLLVSFYEHCLRHVLHLQKISFSSQKKVELK